jgi:excisionase family DNA binding protein
MAGPEETALADMERATENLLGLFRGLAERLAAKRAARKPRRQAKVGTAAMLTPPQVAKRLGVSPDKILDWIRKGELHATNVATTRAGRPRYRISEEDLTIFQRTRQPSRPPAPPPPRKQKKVPGLIEYFK